MRSKAEQLVSDLLHIQPKLRKILLNQDDLWTPEVIAELQSKGYVTVGALDLTAPYDEKPRAINVMILTTRAIDELSKEEVNHAQTSTYLSTYRPSGDADGGGGTGEPDCDTCRGPEHQRDADGKATGGGGGEHSN